jgi:hypothetical protein
VLREWPFSATRAVSGAEWHSFFGASLPENGLFVPDFYALQTVFDV